MIFALKTRVMLKFLVKRERKMLMILHGSQIDSVQASNKQTLEHNYNPKE